MPLPKGCSSSLCSSQCGDRLGEVVLGQDIQAALVRKCLQLSEQRRAGLHSWRSGRGVGVGDNKEAKAAMGEKPKGGQRDERDTQTLACVAKRGETEP